MPLARAIDKRIAAKVSLTVKEGELTLVEQDRETPPTAEGRIPRLARQSVTARLPFGLLGWQGAELIDRVSQRPTFKSTPVNVRRPDWICRSCRKLHWPANGRAPAIMLMSAFRVKSKAAFGNP